MRESKHLEYKEAVSNSFLKTVSAYANYGDGEIVFGVADDGAVKGVKNPKTACLDIENRINDSISPVPEYTLRVNPKTSVVTLTVFEGQYKPYLYKSKAYRRNDSSTIAVNRLALGRLILEGQNLSFEELPAKSQKLTFRTLLKEIWEILVKFFTPCGIKDENLEMPKFLKRAETKRRGISFGMNFIFVLFSFHIIHVVVRFRKGKKRHLYGKYGY